MNGCAILSLGAIGAVILAGAIWTVLAIFIGYMAGQAFGWIKAHDRRFSDGDDA